MTALLLAAPRRVGKGAVRAVPTRLLSRRDKAMPDFMRWARFALPTLRMLKNEAGVIS